MSTPASPARRRGRPPKPRASDAATRDLILQAGLQVLTEKGFSATGLDELLNRAGVPKGSFYHYFASKEQLGLALIERYGAYFARKLDRHFDNTALAPLARLQAFIDDASEGMAQHAFRRGCLIGNLGQEMGALPDSFRAHLCATFEDWQQRLQGCLQQAIDSGQLRPDCDTRALSAAFWIGWEGAVLRAKLERSAQPLAVFASFYLNALPKP